MKSDTLDTIFLKPFVETPINKILFIWIQIDTNLSDNNKMNRNNLPNTFML
jgi:hypothetical protein